MRFVWLLMLSGCVTLRPVSPLPENFRWGVATAGFQSEGHAPDSNWKRYIEKPGSAHEPYRESVDFWNRYKEDIALAAGLGVNTFRLSVEWARVMPKRGQIDEDALKHYDEIFAALAEHHLTPMVTLLHFVMPGWVMDEGGLASPAVVDSFGEFARVVAQRYRGRGVMWITLNEPSYFVLLEDREAGWGGEQLRAARRNVIAMHLRAYAILHSVDAGAPVSINVVWLPPPVSLFEDWCFDAVKRHIDFVAVDFYYSFNPPDFSVAYAATGEYWRVRFHPEILVGALRSFSKRVPHLPVYVVENGMATDDGKPRDDGMTRGQHLREHVYWLQRARDEGINVIGYNYWSITDNYEWGNYRNRFGLYTVDVASDSTLARKPTDAVEVFRELIRNRGVR